MIAEFALPAQLKLRKNVEAPSSGCCDNLLFNTISEGHLCGVLMSIKTSPMYSYRSCVVQLNKHKLAEIGRRKL